MTKNTLLISLVWFGLAGCIYYLADQAYHPNKSSTLGDGHRVVLQRGADGHYRAEAYINNTKVNVLVDTGATGVAISQAVADKLHLNSHTAIATQTANGESVAYMVRLNSVRLGGINARNVSAMITPTLSGDVLLGMSFLGRMDVRLFQNTMTIKQVEAD